MQTGTARLTWERHTYEDGTTMYWRSTDGRFKIEPYFGPIIEHGEPHQRQGWWLLERDEDFVYERGDSDLMSVAQAKDVAAARAALAK